MNTKMCRICNRLCKSATGRASHERRCDKVSMSGYQDNNIDETKKADQTKAMVCCVICGKTFQEGRGIAVHITLSKRDPKHAKPGGDAPAKEDKRRSPREKATSNSVKTPKKATSKSVKCTHCASSLTAARYLKSHMIAMLKKKDPMHTTAESAEGARTEEAVKPQLGPRPDQAADPLMCSFCHRSFAAERLKKMHITMLRKRMDPLHLNGPPAEGVDNSRPLQQPPQAADSGSHVCVSCPKACNTAGGLRRHVTAQQRTDMAHGEVVHMEEAEEPADEEHDDVKHVEMLAGLPAHLKRMGEETGEVAEVAEPEAEEKPHRIETGEPEAIETGEVAEPVVEEMPQSMETGEEAEPEVEQKPLKIAKDEPR